MATEVSGENYDSLLKEMETLKGRLDEERLKLNDVACKLKSNITKTDPSTILLALQYPLFLNVLKVWHSLPSNLDGFSRVTKPKFFVLTGRQTRGTLSHHLR